MNHLAIVGDDGGDCVTGVSEKGAASLSETADGEFVDIVAAKIAEHGSVSAWAETEPCPAVRMAMLNIERLTISADLGQRLAVLLEDVHDHPYDYFGFTD
jgi:hypothetical protein